MAQRIDRRQLLAAAGVLAVTPVLSEQAAGLESEIETKSKFMPDPEKKAELRYCLNTSTISGQKLTLPQQIEVAAAAGYQGIEPWLRDIHACVEQGHKLAEVGKRIADVGLTVESAIGFARWIVDDDAEREQGLRDAQRDMQAVKALGGTRIAAPPVGATGPMDLDLIAQRYRALLEVGEREGVVPQLELWGHSPAIHRLGQLAYIATEAGHRDACVLPDVYHIFKGGSEFQGLPMLAGSRIHVFHMNDYPNDPPRETIRDEHRVYPGDGVAPIPQILRDIAASGFRGALSLELFNRSYWQQDPAKVAATGLQKMRSVVQAASQ